MKLNLDIGNSSFRGRREEGSYYIDKSFLISELLACDAKVLLLPRPRRFGKTLNLSMLDCFFDMNQQSGPLFEGLAVTRDAVAMAQLNSFPTLVLSFLEMDHTTWESCQVGIQGRIANLVGTHLVQLKSVADSAQTAILEDLHFRRAKPEVSTEVLLLLTKLLYQATGKRVVILIDEYDKLIHESRQHGYFPEMVSWMRRLMGLGLKDNPYLERAVITGILRIAKESIYSGLNNLAVYSILDPEFATCFGFTQAEVHQLLRDAGLADQEEGVKDWYNGYTFGKGEVIYNPWSILNYVSRSSSGFMAHWLNTSANDLAREMIQEGTGIDLNELEQLIEGRSVHKHLDVNVGMRELTSESIWNLLLFTGYLTATNYNPAEATADLSIPNTEVRYFFKNKISSWFGKGSPDKLVDLLLQEKMAAFAKGLSEAVKSILSFHDTGGTTPERVYHIFVVGLMLHLSDSYRIESNSEAGHGRADLLLIPRKPGGTGFLFEFKTTATGDLMNLAKFAQAALKQIEDRDYPSRLRKEQANRMVAIGCAFHGKQIALATFNQDLINGKSSTPELYIEGHAATYRKPTKPKIKSQASMPDDQQKRQIISQIQALQEQKGQPILPTESMISADLQLLQAMLTNLKG